MTDNSWDENRKFMLDRIEDHEKRLESVEKRHFDTYTDFVILKTKWGLTAAIVSIAFTAIINVVIFLLGQGR